METVSLKEQLLAGYLNALPAQAYIKDLEGNFVYVNQQFAAAHAQDDSDSLQQKGTYTDADFGDGVTSEQPAVKGEAVLQTKGGQPRSSGGLSLKFPIKNAEGVIVGVGGFIQAADDKSPATAALCRQETPLPEEAKEEKTTECWEDSSSSLLSSSFRQQLHPQSEVRPPLWGNKHGQSYLSLFTDMQMGAFMAEIVTDDKGGAIDFQYMAINPAFIELTNLQEVDTIGKRATSVLPGLLADAACGQSWMDQFGQVALEGNTWRFERKWCCGFQRWVSGMAYRPHGQQNRFVVLLLNVSEQVETTTLLQESEERHRNLFESMMQGVVYQGHDGSIIAANPSAERILGLTVDQMMGRTSVDPRWKSIHEDGSEFPGHEHPSMMALKTGKPVTGVVMGVFHPTTEQHHWIIIDSIPRFKPGETTPYQVYSTFTDLTETKEFERKLLQEKERAEMADKLKSSFLANMSHEIRTPLNGIIGHIDLALSNELSQEQRNENLDGLVVARQSGELLISIIQDILDLSKIEAGQMTVKNDEHFSLRSLAGQVARLGQTMITQRCKTIAIEHDVQGEIADSICGDPFRLQQVLNNLVSNAVKFTDKGKVSLAIKLVDNQTIEFSVRDTGKGIPDDHLESIFEPFRQVEIGDTRKHGGTGLGLTISKKLVEMMGGRLSLVSSVKEQDKGSCFSFTFPYKVAHVQTPPPAPGQETHETPCRGSSSVRKTSSSFAEGKILVAEDERVSRRLVKRMLDISGYDVILAEDGQQAVECFEKHHTDISLILMDVQMPNIDGLEATSLIREMEATMPERDPVPIIALSAGAMKGDNERGLAVGMTAYLTKPVNFKLLQETLRQQLGVPPAPQPK